MIRRCSETDFEIILTIINDASTAYKGVIPADRWHEPYISREELRNEIHDGIVFWGYEEAGQFIGVMGIQDKGDVTLIRHAYVMTKNRRNGIGSSLLIKLADQTDKPILIGTWADATWAVTFYEKHGFHLVSPEEKTRLLKRYWNIPERQVDTSVVLVDAGHRDLYILNPH